MDGKEYREKIGKILGIKSGQVIAAGVGIKSDDHLNQIVDLKVIPSKYQAKKIKDLVYEFGNLKEAD